MRSPAAKPIASAEAPGLSPEGRGLGHAAAGTPASFAEHCDVLFTAHFQRLWRFTDRLCGDPDLAADLVQEAFVKLIERGSLPDAPAAWLITVTLNLFRNQRTTRARRGRLLTLARAAEILGDSPPAPDQTALADDTRRRVRAALDQLPEREQALLLLQAEGYRYRDIAAALDLNEASVGVLLARARRAFRAVCADGESHHDAP